MKNLKQEKGKAIADSFQLRFDGELWTVPSQRGKGEYIVDLLAQTCTCPSFNEHKLKCKHIYAVEVKIMREHRAMASPEREIAARKKPTYKRNWHNYNESQKQQKPMFEALLYELCTSIRETRNRRGRPRASLADVVFCVNSKIFNNLAGRPHTGDVKDAFEKGYISNELHYNTIHKYLESEELTLILRDMIETTAAVLKPVESEFAIDASGFSTCQYKRWLDVKYGGNESWHDWYKLHLSCGIKTGIITAVEISERYAHDNPYFRRLFDSTFELGFIMKRVMTDAAYTTKANFRYSEKHGVEQFSEFKSNATFNAKDTVWNKMLHFYLSRQDEFYKIYHRRSRVESLFSALKRRLGGTLRARHQTAQINELLSMVLCYNICTVIRSMYELDIEPEFRSRLFPPTIL